MQHTGIVTGALGMCSTSEPPSSLRVHGSRCVPRSTPCCPAVIEGRGPRTAKFLADVVIGRTPLSGLARPPGTIVGKGSRLQGSRHNGTASGRVY